MHGIGVRGIFSSIYSFFNFQPCKWARNCAGEPSEAYGVAAAEMDFTIRLLTITDA